MSALKPYVTGTFETTEPEAMRDRQLSKDIAEGKLHVRSVYCPSDGMSRYTYCGCNRVGNPNFPWGVSTNVSGHRDYYFENKGQAERFMASLIGPAVLFEVVE
jgi:hypothetical protein